MRELTRADVPAVAELCHRCDASHRAWAGDVPVPPVAAAELEWHTRLVRRGCWAVVALDDDGATITGAASFAAAREGRDSGAVMPGLAHLSALFVDPPHWRRGIGRALLAAAEDAMREQRYERARLVTLEGSPAERLYAACGWERTHVRDVFAPMGLPTIQYVKALSRPA
ncbi:MAG TPA: GNAT family N-acetyltransferase [Baekduia sp.]|nr:GNAT family N-acetyltransferase [Baekduia sp.]